MEEAARYEWVLVNGAPKKRDWVDISIQVAGIIPGIVLGVPRILKYHPLSWALIIT